MAMTIGQSAAPTQPIAEASVSAAARFEAAFEEHWPWVCRVLYQLVGDWGEAEDLALEVFMQLHRRPPREVQPMGSWLYRVATNAGLNALRSRQRRARYEEEAEALALQRAPSHDPAATVEEREEQRRVRRVLAQLNPRAAQLLILRHSGLSYAETAVALNLSPGSVGTLLARAEKDFARCYRSAESERLPEGSHEASQRR